ncbi:MAG TPA: hypothetical protein PLK30_04490, partial [Blastocatellia bacterium]|nr:hypothetical protein [Blastocatellia bacterium]
ALDCERKLPSSSNLAKQFWLQGNFVIPFRDNLELVHYNRRFLPAGLFNFAINGEQSNEQWLANQTGGRAGFVVFGRAGSPA